MTVTMNWIAERVPPDRDLSRPELVELATAIGHNPELWQPLVRHDPNQRVYVQLYRDLHVDVWLICWLNDQKTGAHDHDVSSGGVYVCEGAIVEDRFRSTVEGLRWESHVRGAGEAFHFDAAYIHGMRHAGGPAATSIHCYSPPLWRMGYYEFDDEGSLCRTSVTYLDEVAEGGGPH
jgi:hypothetical protein